MRSNNYVTNDQTIDISVEWSMAQGNDERKELSWLGGVACWSLWRYFMSLFGNNHNDQQREYTRARVQGAVQTAYAENAYNFSKRHPVVLYMSFRRSRVDSVRIHDYQPHFSYYIIMS